MSHRSKPLINLPVDFLMMGGISLLLVPVLMLFGHLTTAPSNVVASLIFVMSLIVNIPHFATSYQLFYVDNRGKIFRSLSWFLVGIVLPLFLIIALGIFYVLFSLRDIGYIISLMIYLFGWHYSRQAFSFILLYAERNNYVFTSHQKITLKVILMSVWLLSLTSLFSSSGGYTFFSVEYPYSVLPEGSHIFIIIAMALSSIYFVGLTAQRYLSQRTTPHWMCGVPLVSVCLWLWSSYHQAIFFMLIPIFHALQYLLFAYALKLKLFQSQYAKTLAAKKTVLYFLMALFLGVLILEISPRVLDMVITYKQVDLTLFVAIFATFVNLHHYFLDFVFWKNDAGLTATN